MTILVCSVVFLCLVISITAIDTQSNGFFTQERIGQHGKSFLIYKLRTLHAKTNKSSLWGRMLRKTKLDEIPQLLNILNGQIHTLNQKVIFGQNMVCHSESGLLTIGDSIIVAD